ncbi:hypothetical protein OH77DRAFT_906372 [Trametes cingulata]|nr:hypothetical protein OH77DRAFT_906372 [Trametes cingulata]
MFTSRTVARGLLFLSVNAVLLSSVYARQDLDIVFPTPTPAPVIVPRQFFPFPGKDTSATGSPTGSDTAVTPPTTTGGNAQTTPDPNSGSASNTNNSGTASDTSAGNQSTSGGSSGTDTSGNNQTTPPASPTVSQSLSTNSAGDVSTIEITVTPPASGTSSTTSASAGADQSNKPSSEGISKSTIIGLSVAGGVALIGIVTFVVWKFTRKRFTDDDFDNEAIKWPDLNTHGEETTHALPTNRTGGAGFETSSQVNLTRPDSRAGSVAPSAGGSSVDLYSSRDPYAVPPLPHLNPNVTQPYRDDPSAAYYDNDPYAPAPPTEAIPMTQINRARSPGPQAAYGYTDGRVSPGPQQALGVDPRARSPGPGALYGAIPQAGRASPGPQAAYGPGPGY